MTHHGDPTQRHRSEFAINASNYRHWAKPVRAYIDDCLAGSDTGPRGKQFQHALGGELWWLKPTGSCAAAGVFLYPGDARPGYENGRLRMIYECAPIAFLVEQAGGKATPDGCDAILDQQAETLHGRTRLHLWFGQPQKVDRVAAYHDLPRSGDLGPVRTTRVVPRLDKGRTNEQETPHHFGDGLFWCGHEHGQGHL